MIGAVGTVEYVRRQSTMLSRLIQLFFVCIRHTNSIQARQGWRQRSAQSHKPPKSQARRDINLTERKLGIQRTIKICGCSKKGYNLTLKEWICHFGSCGTRISLRRVSCIYSHLHYMVKAISCHLAEHLNESKFNGNYWKDRKRVGICTWLRFIFGINRFSYYAQVIYMVS